MIANPDRYLEAYVDAGASMLSVHAEVLPHLHRTMTAIKDLGAKAGVALNPSTPIAAIEDVAADLDVVLVMSVNPGFGGQRFIAAHADKIRRVRDLLAPHRQSRRHRSGRRHRPRHDRAVVEAGRHASSSPGTPSSVTATRPARRGRCAGPPARRAMADRAGRGRRARRRRRTPAREPRARALRRDRPDGRGLLRQLPRLVRGGPHRLAARRRPDLPRARSRGPVPAGDRGAVRVPIAGPLRRRAGGAGDGAAGLAGPARLRLRHLRPGRRRGHADDGPRAARRPRPSRCGCRPRIKELIG